MQPFEIELKQDNPKPPFLHQLKQTVTSLLQHPNLNIHESNINARSLLTFRVIAFAYLTIVQIWNLLEASTLFSNIQYIANISSFLIWLNFALALQDYALNRKADLPIVNNLKHFVEIIFEAGFCLQLPATLIFWAFAFWQTSGKQMILVVNIHTGPFICILVEYFYNTYSFPIKHLPIIFIFSLLYVVLNIIYSLQLQPIYPKIDWHDFISYLFLAIFFLTLILMHLGARFLRKKIGRRSKGEESGDLLQKESPEKGKNRQLEIMKEVMQF